MHHTTQRPEPPPGMPGDDGSEDGGGPPKRDPLAAIAPFAFELDPFISPGEIAICIPGLPVFFEDSYHAAELSASAWCAWLLRWQPLAIVERGVDAPLDVAFAPVGWEA